MSYIHHHHHHSDQSSDRGLIFAVSINILLTAFQFIGGLISGSLALIADALHNLSDASSLGIAIIARKISRKPADDFKTFGYKRAETIAALINLTILVVISIYLVYEAVWRFISPSIINGRIIIIVAGIALVIDLVTAFITLRLSKNNLNMKAAFLHNLSDALSSLAVIISGVLISIYQWFWIDSFLTMILALFILYQAFVMLPKTIHLLMEGAPEAININEIKSSILNLKNIEDIHHVHIWSLDEKTIALEAHIVANINTFDEMEAIKQLVKQELADNFNITHSTLEFEHEMMC
jgi:cobalt-zinc-cadmium efflux system protein